jgi:hypothetical protein
MPTYTFRNKDTGEIFDHVMRMSEYDDYMKNNPHVERHFESASAVVDPHSLGIQKPPSDFQKYVVDSIQRRNRSIYNAKSKYSVPKEW